jgi:potassium voltage-gated channel Shaw-related subfamily C protein
MRVLGIKIRHIDETLLNRTNITSVQLKRLQYPSQQYSLEKDKTRPHPYFFYLELASNIWFTIEIIIRLIFTPNTTKFVKNPVNIIDFVATASFYIDWMLEYLLEGSHRDTIEFFNIVRVLRLFKLTQHSAVGSTLKIFK